MGLVRSIPALMVLAAGCAPQTPYRYARGMPGGARGTITLSPHATVGELRAAVRGANPGERSCPLWFDVPANESHPPDRLWIVVVSGDLRVSTEADCEMRLVGRVGIKDQIVLSTGSRSGGFRWCQNGESMWISSKGAIPSLRHNIERQLVSYRGIAWAAWSSDDAHETLAIIERFRAAGVPLMLVDEEKAEPPGSFGLHDCEPREAAAE